MRLEPALRRSVEFGIAFSAITTLILAGCGGGRSSNTPAAVLPATTTSTTITPFKGMFYSGGAVTLKDANGNPVTLVSGGSIGANGSATVTFNANVSYPLIVEVSGSYYNENTGMAETTSVPLRGLIESSLATTAASGIAVTLVSETAVADLQARLGSFSSSNPLQIASAVASLNTSAAIFGVSASAVPAFNASTHQTSDANTLRLAAWAVVANQQNGNTLAARVNSLANAMVSHPASAPATIVSQAAFNAALTAVTSGASSVMAAGTTLPAPITIPTTSYAALYNTAAANIPNIVGGGTGTASGLTLTPAVEGFNSIPDAINSTYAPMNTNHPSGLYTRAWTAGVLKPLAKVDYWAPLDSLGVTIASYGKAATLNCKLTGTIDTCAGKGISMDSAAGTLSFNATPLTWVLGSGSGNFVIDGALTFAPFPGVKVTATGPGSDGQGGTTGLAVSTFATGLSNPTQVTGDSLGNLYATNWNTGTIAKISASGVVSTFASGLNGPTGIVADSYNNLYVSSHTSNAIMKVSPTGVVSTFASGLGEVQGIAIDSAHNLYVSDWASNSIKKITPTGTVTHFASGFFGPSGMSMDSSDNLYVADTYGHKVKKVTPAGVVSTVAGATAGSSDGTGTAALFKNPFGLTVDTTGNIYVADSNNHTLRKIDPTGVVTTIAGLAGSSGNVNDTGSQARFNMPRTPYLDNTGKLYIPDSLNHHIRVIQVGSSGVPPAPGNQISAPTNVAASALSASQINLTWTAVNGATGYNVYRATASGVALNTATKITASPVTTTALSDIGLTASTPYYYTVTALNTAEESVGSTEVAATTIISAPTGAIVTSVSPTQIVLSWQAVAAATGYKVYRATAPGVVVGPANLIMTSPLLSTSYHDTGLATRGFYYYTITAVNALGESVGSTEVVANTAQMGGAIQRTALNLTASVTTPIAYSAGGLTGASAHGLTTDGSNLYVAEWSGSVIRKISIANGTVTTLAGGGWNGASDGVGILATFNQPTGITTDGTNLYVTDSNHHTIRKIVIATGAVSTFAGTANIQGAVNGTGTAASFQWPNGITTDGTNLYVAEGAFNYRIRKIVIATREVTTVAGSGVSGVTDGLAAAASFQGPVGITTDGVNLYVADKHAIRQIVIATGQVSTLAGSATPGGGDGTGAGATFNFTRHLTSDGTHLYVADGGGYTVRKIVIATGEVITLAGTPGLTGVANGTGTAASFIQPYGITSDGTHLYVSDGDRIRRIE